MILFYPNVYKDFHCLAGACPDSCCRQGWQIPVDTAHQTLYETLPGALGEAARRTLIRDGEETFLRMENGACALLREDGLCPLEAEYGADALCDICRTHPRFIEVYGGRKEIHLSFSCPEAARLALAQTKPVFLASEQTEEPVTEPFDADPEAFLALLEARTQALRIAQDRRVFLPDRIALLLRFAIRLQRLFNREEYALCKPLADRLLRAPYRDRALAATLRLRLRGTSYFPDLDLLRGMEHLTEDFPRMLNMTAFTRHESRPFWEAHTVELENLLSLWLAHYLPKAVRDGNARSRVLLAVFLTLAAVRLCVCSGEELASAAALLAKELEHSEDNLAALCEAFARPGWTEHLTAQLPLPQKGEMPHAV